MGRKWGVCGTATACAIFFAFPMSVCAQDGTLQQYIVKPGDYLEKIAEEVYGDGSSWRALYEANRDAIGENPDLILPGTKIFLPGKYEALGELSDTELHAAIPDSYGDMKCLFYLQDEKGYFVPDMDNPQERFEVWIPEGAEDFIDVTVSDQGHYLYYKCVGTSTLFCVDLEKSKEMPQDLEQAAAIITEDYSTYSEVYGEDGMVYKTNEDELFYFDGKESRMVSAQVEKYEVNHENGSLYYLKRNNGDYSEADTLPEQLLNQWEEPEETDEMATSFSWYRYRIEDGQNLVIADDIGEKSLWYAEDFVVYFRENKQGGLDLYARTAGSAEEQIVSGAAYCENGDVENKSLYYFVASEEKVSYRLYYWKMGQGSRLIDEEVAWKEWVYAKNSDILLYGKRNGQVMLCINGQKQELPLEKGRIPGCLDVSADEQKFVIGITDEEGKRILDAYRIEAGEPVWEAQITDSAMYGCWNGNLYLYTELTDDKAQESMNYCAYKEEKKKVLGENIPSGAWDSHMYKDGTLMAWMRQEDALYQFRIGQNGRKIDNSIDGYGYVDAEHIVYLKDNILYVAGLKETCQIAENVSQYACNYTYIESDF